MEDDVGIVGEEEKKKEQGGGKGRLQGRGVGLVDRNTV